MAEEISKIVEMRREALETSLRDHLAMLEALEKNLLDEKPTFVSVNVSGRQLLVLLEIDVLRDIIENAGVDLCQMKLEIAESLMVHEAEHAAGRRKTKRVGHSASHR